MVEDRGRKLLHHWPLFVALVAAVLCYLPVLNGRPIWDDNTFLFNNPIIQAPDGLYRFWFTTEPSDYWPLSNSLLWVTWQIFGSNTTPYHVMNLGLHLLNLLLLFVLLRQLRASAAPALVVLLFALHPVNVETVAWIFQLKTLLATTLALGSSILFFRNHRTSAVLLFLLALLAKTSVATLPVLLLLLSCWREGALTKRSLLRTAPFFLIALLLGLLAIWFHSQHYAVGTATVRDAGLLERLAATGWIAGFYLLQALLPVSLNFVYPLWSIEPVSFLAWLPLAAWLIAAIAAWRLRSRATLLLLAYWVLLFPALGFVDIPFMQFSLVADHWQYLALPVPLVGLVLLLERGAAKLNISYGPPAVILVIAAVLGFLTLQRSRLWQDEITLYTDTVEKNPRAWMAQINLGKALASDGRAMEALPHFEAAIEANPKSADAHSNLGNALASSARFEEAREHFAKAIALEPSHYLSHYNLGNLLTAQHSFDEAAKHYAKAIALSPQHADAHNNLANLLARSGKTSEAVEHYQEALRIAPHDDKARLNLAKLLIAEKKIDEAIRHFEILLRQKPDMGLARAGLAYAHALAGRLPEALDNYRQVPPETFPPEQRSNLQAEINRLERMLSQTATRSEP